jgi:putative ABC transport system permease protein
METGSPIENQQWFSLFNASNNFEKIFNVEFIHGRSFKPDNQPGVQEFIINEAAAKSLGWETDDAVGRALTRFRGNVSDNGTVVGVVKDFHYRPVYDPIKPLVIARIQGGTKMCIKINNSDIKETLAFIETEWKANFDDAPFRYSFLDKDFELMYAKEESLKKSIQYFSILAIFIACLGLLGLSSYSTENRKKEIGIRKVNGATTLELLGLLTKDFSRLVMVAFVISVPTSYYFGNLWLNDFAYRVQIGVDVFLVAGVLALLIAIVTVSYHTIRVAIGNPVNSLRYE